MPRSLQESVRRFFREMGNNRKNLLYYIILPAVAILSVVVFTVVLNNRSAIVSQSESSASESSLSQSSAASDSSVPESSDATEPESSSLPDDPLPEPDLPVPAVDPVIAEQYAEAAEKNADVKAWLDIPGTTVSHPVLQAHDNDFYLEKGLDKSYYYWGSIFAHFRNNMTEAQSLSRNTVLFGHNKDDGLLFGELMNFSEQEYAEQHRTISLTIGDEVTHWVIFSVMDCEVNNDVFYYINALPDDAELQDILDQSKDRSFWDYDLDVSVEDRILTLSTCTYKYTYSSGAYREDVRFVVMARQLRPGETLDGEFTPITANADRRQPTF